MQLGVIGQGWIGKNYSDNFEERGFDVVRYSIEEPYIKNKDRIKDCDIVFIAVPTPTTPEGYDDSIIREVLPLVGKGKIAVIKSTLVPGRTEKLQEAFPDILILFSPEFLSEATARYDADNPDRNVIGIPHDTKEYKDAAEKILTVLPEAPYTLVCTSREAEFIKYSHNVAGYIQIMFSNMFYDLAQHFGVEWHNLKEAMNADPMMSHTYLNPVHKGGRGAGGHCFIKDFAAFRDVYEKELPEEKEYINMMKALEQKNIKLLKGTNKDLDLLEGVYGKDVLKD